MVSQINVENVGALVQKCLYYVIYILCKDLVKFEMISVSI